MLKQVKEWLKKPGNSKIKLALKLGYSSSNSISQWLARGAVPEYQIEKLKRVLK